MKIKFESSKEEKHAALTAELNRVLKSKESPVYDYMLSSVDERLKTALFKNKQQEDFFANQ